MAKRTCSFPGCEEPHSAHGFCNMHVKRWRAHGDPSIKLKSGPKPGHRKHSAEERFWPKVEKSGPVPAHHPELGQCWLWLAAHDNHGYGVFWYLDRLDKAPRAAYDLLVGPISSGLSVLHRCDNPPCVRPDHLFLGTSSDNMADKAAKGRGVSPLAQTNRNKTHCPRGHPYDEANTYVDSKGKRYCRACWRQR